MFNNQDNRTTSIGPSVVFIVNFVCICSTVSVAEFEQVNATWVSVECPFTKVRDLKKLPPSSSKISFFTKSKIFRNWYIYRSIKRYIWDKEFKRTNQVKFVEVSL